MRKLPEFLGSDDRSLESYLGLAESEAELREMISFLIQHREELRDSALRSLGVETEKLLGQLDLLKREELLAELSCFKDCLGLQRRLLHEGRD